MHSVSLWGTSGSAGYFELCVMPTEDYPGPSKSHPEKEDKNDPPRPAGVEPVKPPLPMQEGPVEEDGRTNEVWLGARS